MLYWLADTSLSIMLLLLGCLHIAFFDTPALRWMIGGIMYSFIFCFSIRHHRAIPRLVIILLFAIEDLQRNSHIGTEAISVMISIDMMRIWYGHTNTINKLSHNLDYIMFAVFFMIVHVIYCVLAWIIDGIQVSISHFIIMTVLAICMHFLLSETWLRLYVLFYRYYKRFSA